MIDRASVFLIVFFAGACCAACFDGNLGVCCGGSDEQMGSRVVAVRGRSTVFVNHHGPLIVMFDRPPVFFASGPC
jgi:hypothetical protein